MATITEQYTEEQLNEYLAFLDALRRTGATNMFGAAPYIQETFDVSTKEARNILMYWMETFGERHPDE